jgi:hypothetical protein
MRLFVAITPPPAALGELEAAVAPVRGQWSELRPSRPSRPSDRTSRWPAAASRPTPAPSCGRSADTRGRPGPRTAFTSSTAGSASSRATQPWAAGRSAGVRCAGRRIGSARDSRASLASSGRARAAGAHRADRLPGALKRGRALPHGGPGATLCRAPGAVLRGVPPRSRRRRSGPQHHRGRRRGTCRSGAGSGPACGTARYPRCRSHAAPPPQPPRRGLR